MSNAQRHAGNALAWILAAAQITMPITSNSALQYQMASPQATSATGLTVSWTQSSTDAFTQFGVGAMPGGAKNFTVLTEVAKGVTTKTISFPFTLEDQTVTGPTIGGVPWCLVARARNNAGELSGISNELCSHRVRTVTAETGANKVIWNAYDERGEKMYSGTGALPENHKVVAAAADPGKNAAWIVTKGPDSSGNNSINISSYSVENGAENYSVTRPNIPPEIEIISAKLDAEQGNFRLFLKRPTGLLSQWIEGIDKSSGRPCPTSGKTTYNCYAQYAAPTIAAGTTFKTYKGDVVIPANAMMMPVVANRKHAVFVSEAQIANTSQTVYVMKVMTLDPANGKYVSASYPTNQSGQTVVGYASPVDVVDVPTTYIGNFGIKQSVNPTNTSGNINILFGDIGNSQDANILNLDGATLQAENFSSTANPYISFGGNQRLPTKGIEAAGGTITVKFADQSGNIEVCQFDQFNSPIALNAVATNGFPVQRNSGFCYTPTPGASEIVQNANPTGNKNKDSGSPARTTGVGHRVIASRHPLHRLQS